MILKLLRLIRSNIALVLFAGLCIYYAPYIHARVNGLTGTASNIYDQNTKDMRVYNTIKQYQPVDTQDITQYNLTHL